MLFLITRPRYDLATHYLYYWSKALLAMATSKSIAFIDIKKEKVIKKSVLSYIKKKAPDVVILNGHGSDNSVTGDGSKEILSVSDDLSIFEGKKIYVRSCDSGKLLGPALVKNGAVGFIGYQESFVFPFQPESIHDPITDDIAAICLLPSNQIAEALIKGASVREAHEKGIKVSQEKLEKLQTSSSYDSRFAPFLFWNMTNQVCYE